RTANSNSAGPKVCRNCGAIVGAGEMQCGVCGASISAQPAQRNAGPDHETLRFARAVLDRPYKFTIILLVANLFVFLLMWQSSGLTSAALWEFPEPVLLAYGAKLNRLIAEQHQWWRFVTPMFVHVNLPHVLINMYSLWVVGPYVEKLYGSAKFMVFWVLTGIAGVVASYLTVRPALAGNAVARFLFKQFDVPSAGASGALFGLVGVLFVFGIKFRRELPEGFKRAFGTGMLPIIFINLFIGYLGRGFIDNAAHLGGLVTGAVLAVAVSYRRPGEKPMVATVWRVLQVAMIALIGVCFVKTAQNYRNVVAQTSPRPAVAMDDRAQHFVAYAQAMNDAQDALAQLLREGNTANVDSAITQLDSAPPLDPQADELKQHFKQILIQAKSLKASAAPPPRTATGDDQHRLEELMTSYENWTREYRLWLKTSGRSYGLEEVEPQASPK
ncbi:MAG TPA: rhomboid family intramembrane serine protease, partial [Pyrinomonadaceae bacterium]|nr:rhomboid family intramembrane serine protease [Pyrinomonadaceae bacterium]